jgi:hypothetical protein
MTKETNNTTATKTKRAYNRIAKIGSPKGTTSTDRVFNVLAQLNALSSIERSRVLAFFSLN